MGRILVIDDYPAVLQVMEYALPTFGHAVFSAADGATSLKVAAAEGIDLILATSICRGCRAWRFVRH